MKTKTFNGVEFYQDWDHSEGGIRMTEPKTLKRYHELKAEQPNSENYGVFFAFGDKQFEEGRQRLIEKGYLKEGEKVVSVGAGMYGTESEIDRYFEFYEERNKAIKAECNPQEVYFYEWNNHECMFTNDDNALMCIIRTFGKEVAHTIKRFYEGTPTNVLAPLTQRDEHLGQHRDTLKMLGRLAFDCEGFFSEGDCRYHRTECLWGRSVNREMQEMRDLYRKLPDDIKDASWMTLEEIEDYCKRFGAWAEEEFSKSEYDPVPRTEREKLPTEIYLDAKLYYSDDDGNLQTPTHIWFSNDTRRWHQDERKTHGRAMTSYLGKNGTTLVPVFYYEGLTREYLRRPDLCDVSCKYSYTPYIKGIGVGSRCFDFYYE